MPVKSLYLNQLTESIQQKALELGFSGCGFSKAEKVEKKETDYVERWLSEKKHGTMSWLERNKDKRYDPRLLSEDAKSVISVSYQYFTKKKAPEHSKYIFSKYAYGKDYHFIIKERLKELLKFIEEKTGPRKARIFTDSAPVLERYWAQKAGLGFIGKNTCLINRKNGSFFFIGNIFIDLELNYNTEISPNFCGTCTRCIDACPTSALQPFELDAQKCISYLTIEYRGENIPAAFKHKMKNRVFGCDICQDVCPWNRNAPEHTEPAFEPSEQFLAVTDEQLENMDKPLFKKLFRHTAAERAGFKQLKRNIEFI